MTQIDNEIMVLYPLACCILFFQAARISGIS